MRLDFLANKLPCPIIWGFIAAPILSLGISETFLLIFPKLFEADNNLTPTIPSIEEFAKASFLLIIMTFRYYPKGNFIFSGIISGLGFGITEYIIRMLTTDFSAFELTSFLLGNSFTIIIHTFLTGTIALCFFSEKRILTMLIGFFYAVAMHFLWNYQSLFNGELMYQLFVLFIVIIAYVFLFSKITKTIKITTEN